VGLTGSHRGARGARPCGVESDSVQSGRERITLDANVKAAVEREFAALGGYDIVDTPDEADTVFLVEASYAPLATWGE